MKKAFFYLVFTLFSVAIYSCGTSVPQHCPAYAKSYHKINLKKTKGVNTNVFANGIRVPRNRSYK